MTNYVDVFGGGVVPPSEYGYSAIAITADTQLYWPYNYTGTGVVTSKILEVSAGVGLSLTLPPANEVSVGEDVLLINVGVNTFTVKDTVGNTITTVSSGVSKFVYVKVNSTSAGSWGVFTYGTGTSAADALSLAGDGLSVSGSFLQSNQPVSNYASSHTVLVSERASILNFTGGSDVLTIPAAGTLTSGFWIGVTNNGTGSLTIEPTSPNTIDLATNKILAPGESCIVATDGSNLISLGYGRSSTFVFTQLPVDLTGLSAYTVTSTQAANKLWYFYNTPASNVTVTIPAVASVYYLKAGSLGGFSLVFTTGSGSTYTLAQNQQSIIFCDGVNVTAAQTATMSASSITVGDGTVGAPSLSWLLEPTTGMYRSSAGHIDFAVLGVRRLSITANGVEATDIHNTPAGVIVSTTVQDAINELSTNDATNLAAAKTYADGLVVGLWDDRGSFDASVNTFPTTGGSGTAGAILKGDIWTISVVATSGSLFGYAVGSTVRALIDTPGQTTSNWDILNVGIGYIPENLANKDISGGYAGLTLLKINFKNALNTFTSFFTNSNTASRTYTFPDKDGTVAMTSDITSGSWITKTGNYTAVNGDRIAVNTSGGAVSITLPATPTTGMYVEFTDGGGAFATNAMTVLRNSSTIMGLSEDMTVSTNNIGFGLVYTGSTWRLF